MFEAYVEQFFEPVTGGRGYSNVIRNFKYETEQEAKQKAEELKKEWGTGNFYVGVRKAIQGD